MAVYIILGLVFVGSLFFLAIPFFRGGTISQKVFEPETKDEAGQLADHIVSIKLALRDLDLEHKIGKIDPSDFEMLKKELLHDWKETENKLNKLK